MTVHLERRVWKWLGFGRGLFCISSQSPLVAWKTEERVCLLGSQRSQSREELQVPISRKDITLALPLKRHRCRPHLDTNTKLKGSFLDCLIPLHCHPDTKCWPRAVTQHRRGYGQGFHLLLPPGSGTHQWSRSPKEGNKSSPSSISPL